MQKLEKSHIELGYIPLLDCIAMLWAKHQGYFEDVGLDVTLVREASWASLRDRLAFGHLDAAHCLSAMLPASIIGTDQLGIPLQTSLILSYHQAAFISLRQDLCLKLDIQRDDAPKVSAEKIIAALHDQQNIHLAYVFKNSIHHYCLREWLALADPVIAEKIKLCAFPPQYMVEALSGGVIDGFCVSEPWNIQGELCGFSQIVVAAEDIIPSVADKVLAITADWAAKHPNTLSALTQAIMKAQHDLRDMQDFSNVWQMLVDFNIIQFECSEHQHVRQFYLIQDIIQHFVDENPKPKAEDLEWLIEQMIKWEQLDVDVIHPQEILKQCIVED